MKWLLAEQSDSKEPEPLTTSQWDCLMPFLPAPASPWRCLSKGLNAAGGTQELRLGTLGGGQIQKSQERPPGGFPKKAINESFYFLVCFFSSNLQVLREPGRHCIVSKMMWRDSL